MRKKRKLPLWGYLVILFLFFAINYPAWIKLFNQYRKEDNDMPYHINFFYKVSYEGYIKSKVKKEYHKERHLTLKSAKKDTTIIYLFYLRDTLYNSINEGDYLIKKENSFYCDIISPSGDTTSFFTMDTLIHNVTCENYFKKLGGKIQCDCPKRDSLVISKSF